MHGSENPPPDERTGWALPGLRQGKTDLQPRQLLYIQVDNDPDAARGTVRGELDMSTAPALEEALAQPEAAAAPVLIVDLTHLDFIDSSGLRLLIAAHKRARTANRRLVLIPGTPAVQSVFHITGVDGVLDFSADGSAPLPTSTPQPTSPPEPGS
ncbi:MAG: hypothetical protein NVSMB32_03940 [Actinomycetota bacterium]